MTWLGLSLAQLATIFSATGAVVTALYLLKLRRRRIQVPFTQLWQRVLQEKESTRLFRRLKRLLSLLLQLLFLFLLAVALGNPRLSVELLQGRHLILLLDTSASMKARDSTPSGQTRLEEALVRSREIIKGLRGNDVLMIVRMDGQITPLSTFESNEKTLLKILEKIEATDTRADLTRALLFCADALHGKVQPTLILVGDGSYPEAVLKRVLLKGKGAERKGRLPLDVIDLRGITVYFVPVGHSKDNLGILAFNARRYPHHQRSFEIFLEVANYRDHPAEVDLQLIAQEQIIEVQRLQLKARETARFTCDSSSSKSSNSFKRPLKAWCELADRGTLLQARLTPPGRGDAPAGQLDPFPTDDQAYALLPPQPTQRVLLVSKGNLYLEGALLLDENITVKRVAPAQYTPLLLEEADAVIFDYYSPPEPPKRPTLWLSPSSQQGPFPVDGLISAPLITEQNNQHPVMRWVTLKDLNISVSLRFKRIPEVIVLASSFRAPIIVATEAHGIRSVGLGFDITRSDLPLRVAFPLLILNSLEWFAGDQKTFIASYVTGQTWSIPLPALTDVAQIQEVRVVGPDGHRRPNLSINQGRVQLYGDQVGIYSLDYGRGKFQMAANLADAQESDITPQSQLRLGTHLLQAPPRSSGSTFKQEIWLYLLLAAFGLSLVEWLTYNRRVTV